MSISQVRTYFQERMLVVSPSRSEWTDAFNIENVPQTNLDIKYHIGFGINNSSTQNDRSVEDNLDITLTIWKRGYNDVASALDAVLDEAHCIRLDVINHSNMYSFNTATGNENLQDIVLVSITPQEIDASNDNTVQVQLVFNTRLFFGIA